MSIVSRILAGYTRFAKRYPFAVQMTQTGLLMGAGDTIAQQLIEKTEKHDWLRTKQFVAIGFLFVGPTVTAWYKILDKKFGRPGCNNPKVLRMIGVKKMLTDQLLFAPLFLGIFLITVGRLKCKTWDRNLEDVKTQYKDVLITNYTVWPLVQLVNFTFVPLHLQVLVVQSVALFWNSYLSWRTAKTGDGSTSEPNVPDDDQIVDSFLCKPKEVVSTSPRNGCKSKEAIVIPKEVPNKGPEPVPDQGNDDCDESPPEEDNNESPLAEDYNSSTNKPTQTICPVPVNNTWFLLQTAMLVSIIMLTLND